jgi:precorrin-6A/cobalt-precorrin-6A reductase
VILLLGGTGESARIAEAIRDAGLSVLVSMATEIPLALPSGPGIESRRGRLNLEQLVRLIEEIEITALVDAAHPFAAEAHKTAMQAAQRTNIPYLHWLRDESDLSGYSNLHMAADHQSAAQMAATLRRPILLTIGSRNLLPYVHAARGAALPVYARVLPCQESEESCRLAGLDKSKVIAARGPFAVEDTLVLLRGLEIGTLVTKESGRVGGVAEKLEAATRAKCNVVIVQRTAFNEGHVYRTFDALIGMLTSYHR